MKLFYALIALVCCFFARPGFGADGDLPAQQLEFVQNKGQWDDRARYAAALPGGGQLFVEDAALTFALLASGATKHPHAHGRLPVPPAGAPKSHAYRVSFVGARGGTLAPAGRTPGGRNYFLGNDPHRWASQVPSYRQLRYPQLWPGVGARLYENAQQQLEYDFELAPHAAASQIKLRYDGADDLRLTREGALEISTSVGKVTELAPRAWQLDPVSGRRRAVSCRYVLRGREISFALGPYAADQPLVIDPTVVFSTFTGSSADNWGFTATYGPNGHLYSGGIVFNTGYPVSLGAFDTGFNGTVDIAVIKYNTAVSGPAARVWATYLGGAGTEYPHSLVVNDQDELVLLGTTGSADYPVGAAAFDRLFNGGPFIDPYGLGEPNLELSGGSDLVLTHLNAAGSALVGSTYLGGSNNDGLLAPTGATLPLVRNYGDPFRGDVLTDAAGNIYLASCTASVDFPVAGGFGSQLRGSTDAVVCKLNGNLTALLWSSYLGGTAADAAYSLQLDATNKLYVCGGTASANFPTQAGALLPVSPGAGEANGFVARVSSNGAVLEKATYIGTTGYDQAYFVQLDTSGDVYLLGQSLGAYPVSAGRYSVPGGRQFIHKLNPDLSATLFSTVFGTGRAEIDISPTAFLVDQCNRIYVSGWGGINNIVLDPVTGNFLTNGTTTGLTTTADAVQRTTDGSDFYLMQLAPEAAALEYATFFGGSDPTGAGDHVDGGTSRFDRRGFVYQAMCGGCGGNSSLPAGLNTYSMTNGSVNCNNAAFKFNFEIRNVTTGAAQTVCATAAPVPLGGFPAGGVWTGPGVSGSPAGGYVFTPGPALLGTQALTYTVTTTGTCTGQAQLNITVTPGPTVTFDALPQSPFCRNATPLPLVSLSAQPAGGTFGGPGVTGSTFNPNSVPPGQYQLTYTFSANGCSVQATRPVTVVSVTAAAGNSFSVCAGAAAVPLAGTPTGGSWSGPGVTGSVAAGFAFTPTAGLLGPQTLTYSVSSAGCTASSNLVATVLPAPNFSPPAIAPQCVSSAPVSLPASATWSGPGVTTSAAGAIFNPALAGAGQHTLRYAVGAAPCLVSGTIPVSVFSGVPLSLGADTVLCPGSTRAFLLKAAPAGGTWSGAYVSTNGLFAPPEGFSGAVTLTYTFANGACTSTATRRVSVAPAPTLQATWAPVACPDDREAPLRATFTAPGFPATRWLFGDNTQATGESVVHTYAAGTYQPLAVLSYNADRCTVQTALPPLEVKPVFEIPNVITPNGDRKNDFFLVTNGCAPHLQVFTRWGSKVYESAAYANDWNGSNLAAGIYYYLLRQPDGRKVKGWVEIIR